MAFSASSAVLYVDDDPAQLAEFKEKFTKYFKVVTASGGSEGLEILKRDLIQVVVTDQEMGGMSGIEFLKEAQKVAPNVPRIMLTAHQSEELLIQLINEGKSQGYIRKPIEGKEGEVVSLIHLGLQDYLKGEVIRKQNKELRDLVDQVKLSKEKDVAIARLESRHRVVNELGHNLRNPMTSVYGCYQLLGEMGERSQKGKLSDKEKEEMFKQAIQMIGIAAPDMERLYEELKHLNRFIQDETDPTGDGTTPLPPRGEGKKEKSSRERKG